MNFFLRVKHWQLFLIGILVFVLVPFTAGILIVFIRNIKIALMMYPIILVTFIFLWFGWYYSVGINLHKKLPESVNMNLKRFKIYLYIPALYFFAFSILVTWILSTYEVPDGIAQRYGQDNSSFPGIQQLTGYFPYLIPIHFFAVFCIFYCMYFIAKEIKAVELQREVKAKDYIGEFLMIWIWIIGIWFIQPKINRIFGHGRDESNSLDDHMTLG